MWNTWIQWWTNDWFKLAKAKQEKHCVQPDSQKAFQSTHHHHLPWIYCSKTHCSMVLWQKCGIFTFNFITGVMVYNYNMYLYYILYSICAFILNVCRLLFFIVIFLPWYRGAKCVVLTVYHDLNVCYNGRPMLNLKKSLVRIHFTI